jgi:hypothetical protein
MCSAQGFSYTLEWIEFGEHRFFSLGPHATLSYARESARKKEQELNSAEHQDPLQPISWEAFTKKYLDTFYPGYDLTGSPRRQKAESWPKSKR